jgi:hypothetical protein
MYHGLTFSVENGPGLTFSCGTAGDPIKMNGPPPKACMVTRLGRLIQDSHFLYGTYGDPIRENGLGLTFFYGTCSDLIRRMVHVAHGMDFNIWED